MAGARITVDVQDRQVLAVLGELIQRLGNAEPALRDVGEHLLNVHRDRFDAQRAPDGTPWEPLNKRYAKRKKKNADKILVLDGYLKGTLRYQVNGGELLLGTDRIYGATHQFGRPEAGIPPRPFLGLSDADARDVLDILREHLAGPTA